MALVALCLSFFSIPLTYVFTYKRSPIIATDPIPLSLGQRERGQTYIVIADQRGSNWRTLTQCFPGFFYISTIINPIYTPARTPCVVCLVSFTKKTHVSVDVWEHQSWVRCQCHVVFSLSWQRSSLFSCTSSRRDLCFEFCTPCEMPSPSVALSSTRPVFVQTLSARLSVMQLRRHTSLHSTYPHQHMYPHADVKC